MVKKSENAVVFLKKTINFQKVALRLHFGSKKVAQAVVQSFAGYITACFLRKEITAHMRERFFTAAEKRSNGTVGLTVCVNTTNRGI